MISKEFELSLELEMVITDGEGLSCITIGEFVVSDLSIIFVERSGEVVIGLVS